MPNLPPPDSLASFQGSVAAAIMRPLARGGVISRDSRAMAMALVRPSRQLNALERLQIYNQQYWWRLLSSLRDDFAGLHAVLGERKFDRLAVAYLSEIGSSSWNLRDLGQKLGAFMMLRPDLLHPHESLAKEVYAMEWARVIAFDGPALPLLDPQRLGCRASRLRLRLQPYVTLLELRHPVDRLLARLKKSALDADSASNAAPARSRARPLRVTAKPLKKPVHVAVHRVDLSVYFKRLDPAAYRLLRALQGGATLEVACDAAFQHGAASRNAATVQAWFENWMRMGWFAR